MTSADPAPTALTLDVRRIQGITLDLDDTLWPIWPTIERAERVLHRWLQVHAPRTATLVTDPAVLRELREATARERSDLAHDLAALRRESIRGALRRAGEDTALAEPAFEVFYAERQRVQLYDDALPALRWLSERYPLVAVSNGNADLERTGVARWFRTGFSAKAFGSGKPHAPIFRAAAASIGLLPRDVLHVGDDAALDVAGALNAGMQAAWLVRDERPWAEGTRPQLIVPNLHALCMALDG
ncbi:HAD family hydrolase [Xenophilus sp. Marseille-Q4582]|uniref:HAD family hydrolase n=1 Tax=Xenophilus sp. Marseille-Q4582 TaxID=2866600 RepID=UPI001CE4046E|nr:HAD-IA family hydrolase [Xenophilus sp. Marseille-Q4582]